MIRYGFMGEGKAMQGETVLCVDSEDVCSPRRWKRGHGRILLESGDTCCEMAMKIAEKVDVRIQGTSGILRGAGGQQYQIC